MQQWSQKLRNVIPEAETIGVLRDRPGYLVRIRHDQIDAQYLDQIAKNLRQIGASGWAWEVSEFDTLKIRVYTRSSRLWYWLALLCVLGGIYYDVHRITEAIRSWAGT